jgi:hypothetical protein
MLNYKALPLLFKGRVWEGLRISKALFMKPVPNTRFGNE